MTGSDIGLRLGKLFSVATLLFKPGEGLVCFEFDKTVLLFDKTLCRLLEYVFALGEVLESFLFFSKPMLTLFAVTVAGIVDLFFACLLQSRRSKLLSPSLSALDFQAFSMIV